MGGEMSLSLCVRRDISEKRPLIIAGPCSAETEDQLLGTARCLAASGLVNVLRAGIWKPRTRPESFEGIGSKALPWLQRAREETRLPVAVEVATGKQAEEALRFELDVLWIGARTTANPFSVQEVAEALRGVDIPVFVKNPAIPDLELWIGAMERVLRAGIKQTGLIHRGFYSHENADYRNAPMWHIATEMKRRNPGVVFLNDPSRICGRRETLAGVAQKAIDLGFNGLMIESHISPVNAWSDAKQQLTPDQLKRMIEALIWRRDHVTSEERHGVLEQLRSEIDQIDDEIVQMLSRRMNVSEEIGRYKRDNDVAILQAGRSKEVLDRVLRNCEETGLSREFIKRYLGAVHVESIKRQKKVAEGTP